jgi:hypothetical protein
MSGGPDAEARSPTLEEIVAALIVAEGQHEPVIGRES